MVLIYQALVYLEPVTFELRILHRNHLASLGVPESLEYTFYVQPLLGISRNRGYHDKKQSDEEAFYQVASFHILYLIIYIILYSLIDCFI